MKAAIDELTSFYKADVELSEDTEGTVYVEIKDKIYTMYPGQNNYDDFVSYVVADADLYPEVTTEECTNVSNMGVLPVSEDTEEMITDVVVDSEDKNDEQKLTETINSNPSLLVALDSEKDAKVTYSALIEIEESSNDPDEEVIELLKKILTDELEHIALLSALQAKKAGSFVADDSQSEFDEIIDDIKENDVE